MIRQLRFEVSIPSYEIIFKKALTVSSLHEEEVYLKIPSEKGEALRFFNLFTIAGCMGKETLPIARLMATTEFLSDLS